jgi:hypothetical protein
MKKPIIFSFALALAFLSFKPAQPEMGLNVALAGNAISKAQLAVYSHVYAGYGPDFAYNDLKLDVLSYDVAIVPHHGDAYFENIKGSAVTASLHNHFINSRHGDLIVISNVKVKGPTGLMTLQGPTWVVM